MLQDSLKLIEKIQKPSPTTLFFIIETHEGSKSLLVNEDSDDVSYIHSPTY